MMRNGMPASPPETLPGRMWNVELPVAEGRYLLACACECEWRSLSYRLTGERGRALARANARRWRAEREDQAARLRGGA